MFPITVHDSVFQTGWKEIDKTHFTVARGKYFKNLILIQIGPAGNARFFTPTNGNFKALPSRFVEKNGKLFFGWDKQNQANEKIIPLLEKHHLLQNNEFGRDFPEMLFDETLKSADYYFCRNGDLSKFKRIITRKTMYEIPTLCEKTE